MLYNIRIINRNYFIGIVLITVCKNIPNKDKRMEKLISILKQLSGMLNYSIERDDNKILTIIGVSDDNEYYKGVIFDMNKLVQIVKEVSDLMENKSYEYRSILQEAVTELKKSYEKDDEKWYDEYINTLECLIICIYDILDKDYGNICYSGDMK